MAKIQINDFSGGLTDEGFTSDLNCATAFDNNFIKKDKSLLGGYGLDVFSSSAYRVGANKRVSRLAKLATDKYVGFADGSAFLITPSAITEILGPVTSNKCFPAGTNDAQVTTETLNGQILATSSELNFPVKIYLDNVGTPQLRTAGLPVPTGTVTINPSINNSKAYIYAIVYQYSYYVGNTLYEDYSAPLYVPVFNAAGMGSSNNSLVNIPVLSNGPVYNWDTTNIKVMIYRTVHNGDVFYKVKEITNGTTTTTDSMLDADVILQETLYTTGGIQENDQPPKSKYILSANDTAYYLNTMDGTAEKPFRILQAVTNDFDSVPESNLRDFNAEVTGGGTVGRSPIIFTENSTVRLEGLIDELGRGSILPEVISNTKGCLAHGSIVKGSGGLYFASEDGWYFTNGFGEPTKLAKKKIDRIYRQLVSSTDARRRIQGTYDKVNSRVYWTVQESAADNDKIFVYDESFDAFTTISFEGTGIFPTSILMDGETLLIGDKNGYIFKMQSELFNYLIVNTATNPSTWKKTAITNTWRSVQLDGGDASVNKWITKINTQGTPETNVNIQIRSYTNGEDGYKELTPLKLIPSLTWGDPMFTWGDDAFVWDRTAPLNQTRKFPSGRLRARTRQIEFTNAYTEIASSSAPGSYVTVNSGAKTVTLVNPVDYTFGSNNEGYDIVLSTGIYEVSSSTPGTLTVVDPDGTLVNGTYEWSLMGYPKDQRPEIQNFTIEFEPMSDAGTFWRSSSEA